MSASELIPTIIAALAVLLPLAVKVSHAAGYELPWLTALADWFAHRPQVYLRRAKARGF